MSRYTISDDVLFLSPPDGLPRDDPRFLRVLENTATHYVNAQWDGPYKKPTSVQIVKPINWLITDDVEKVRSFELGHDCEDCRDGKRKVEDFLLANPGRTVAMTNLRYVEEWPD